MMDDGALYFLFLLLLLFFLEPIRGVRGWIMMVSGLLILGLLWMLMLSVVGRGGIRGAGAGGGEGRVEGVR